jgi:hypothetical protein
VRVLTAEEAGALALHKHKGGEMGERTGGGQGGRAPEIGCVVVERGRKRQNKNGTLLGTFCSQEVQKRHPF